MTAITTEQEIVRKKRAYCLGRLRDARALVLRDGEAFHEAATALEQVGQVWGGKVRDGMAQYEKSLLKLSAASGNDKLKIIRLLDVVRKARNMAVHEGAWARHLSSRLIDLFLILEEAIMAHKQTVEDIMVQNPLVAESWHLVAQARREMLANSFSCLPIFHDGRWRIITDDDLMRFIRKAANREEELVRLSTNLGMAIDKKDLNPSPADPFPPNTKILYIVTKIQNLPVLVVDNIGGENRLVGIVTAFDLL